jgi:hypothetical protein
LKGTTTLAYLAFFVSDEEKHFMTLRPRANVIKLFTGVIYEFLEHARDFVLGKLFKPDRMFVGEARSMPIEKRLKGTS